MTFLLLKQEMTQPQADQRGSYILFFFFFFAHLEKEERKRKKEKKGKKKERKGRKTITRQLCLFSKQYIFFGEEKKQ